MWQSGIVGLIVVLWQCGKVVLLDSSNDDSLKARCRCFCPLLFVREPTMVARRRSVLYSSLLLLGVSCTLLYSAEYRVHVLCCTLLLLSCTHLYSAVLRWRDVLYSDLQQSIGGVCYTQLYSCGGVCYCYTPLALLYCLLRLRPVCATYF